ncbi:hypothetical protein [Paramagnetospirillum magneticum]|uniref:Uncharacterized protein n=1 Tax=Paramagnetospirillum magneticum (strain ATCC 700264 / AMB-1) TaxID=342108 RepID=Q2W7S5_PARM1|nr:hypothetical protein [Paramagnetospirillum magneticum]BAE50100.1 hypothetical protein amb1296 [Paramagnetospirillum magneticum AMB-1]
MTRIGILSAAIVAAGLVVSRVAPATAGDAKQQIATAAAHAGMAAASPEDKMVRGHLQHVVNCLVGPAGEGYDSAQANPCKDQGFGALQDSPMDKLPALQAALKMARDGMAEPDSAKAREKAVATQSALRGRPEGS